MIQTLIFISGAVAIWLTQARSPDTQRYACLVGLAGQPFWIHSTALAEQWGMLALSVIYTAAWIKGVMTHWWPGASFCIGCKNKRRRWWRRHE